MLKIFLSMMLLITVAFSQEMGKNGGGCTLAQEGVFKVGYNDVTLKGVEYKAKAPSGANFREIFVGSKVLIPTTNSKNVIKAEILDYKPNKRIKGKAKTGLFIIKATMQVGMIIFPMPYIFDAGVMKASATVQAPFGKEKETLKIWFETDVKYSLCYTK
ncbi:MAG: hypothetical protein U9Q40_09095 [Campylobacterota bacterium]|nr:hypothetical protein [Campylobacterota bacterium]